MKEKKQDKNILKMIKYLKRAVENDDNEDVHSKYDDIILYLAKKQDKELVKQIDELVKDIIFWYA